MTSPADDVSIEKRPSGPVTTLCSASSAWRTTEAPGTTAPVESRTIPETYPAADAKSARKTAIIVVDSRIR
jgi:hypothetical protein